MAKDYYKILGVEKNASTDDIKKQYKKLAMKYHPDRQYGKSDVEKKEAEEKFKEISEAVEILTDEEKRRNYDQFGSTDGNGFEGFHGGFGGIDPEEIFRHMRGSGFGFDFGGEMQKPDPHAPKNGRNVRIQVNIPIEDSIYGREREFELDVEDFCPDCHGTGAEHGEVEKCGICNGSGMQTFRRGMMITSTTCQACHGSGYVAKKTCEKCHGSSRIQNTRKFSVNIPRGIMTGNKLRIPGKGEQGVNGGTNGDIYIALNVLDNDIFTRAGDLDLVTVKYISPFTATLGGEVEVFTPWGNEKVTIPEGTESGKVLEIRGKGIKTDYEAGSLYVEIRIEPIINVTEAQKKLLEKLTNTISKKNLKNSANMDEKIREFEEKTKEMRK